MDIKYYQKRTNNISSKLTSNINKIKNCQAKTCNCLNLIKNYKHKYCILELVI